MKQKPITRTSAAGEQPRCASLFSQILNIVDRAPFEATVRRTGAEDRSKGFNCWVQFVAMSFCQPAQAKSLREIEDGVACLRRTIAAPWNRRGATGGGHPTVAYASGRGLGKQ